MIGDDIDKNYQEVSGVFFINASATNEDQIWRALLS